MGEWNDAIHNDVMFLKRQIVDPLVRFGINKFVLIGENVLNFHSSDDCYYEEWYDDVKDNEGWIVGMNFREHIIDEMQENNIHHYLHCNHRYSDFSWRKLTPETLMNAVENKLFKFIAWWLQPSIFQQSIKISIKHNPTLLLDHRLSWVADDE